MAEDYVIRVIGLAAGSIDLDRQVYIRGFDVDAYDGRGHVDLTGDRALALGFASFAAAMDAWRTQSTVHPLRAWDGKPNRPLTAYHVEVEAR